MAQRAEPSPEPIDLHLRRQEMDAGWERRVLRSFIGGLETIEVLREDVATRLRAAVEGTQRTNTDELRELLFLAGMAGDDAMVDLFIGLANPDLADDPEHIDLHERKFLRDEMIRTQFFGSLGVLGQQLHGGDAERVIPVMRLIRRGMVDDYPEVRAAAAEAAGRAVKYHDSVAEHMQAAVPTLSQLLGDPSWEVQRAALRAISEFPDPRSVRALRTFLELLRDEHLRYIASKGIQRIRDRGSRFRFLVRPATMLKDYLSKS